MPPAPITETDDEDLATQSSSAGNARSDASGARTMSSRGSSAKRGLGIGVYLIAGLAVMALVGAFAIGPIQRNLALATLDGFKGDGANPAAITATDAFLDLTSGQVAHVTAAIYGDRGPVEAQVHMAKKFQLFSSLVQIADRPLTGEATGRPTVTLEQRTLAVQAAAELYSPERNAKDLLPDHITEWAVDATSSRELSVAAVTLLLKAKHKNISSILHRVATTKDADPVRVSAAIDGLAELAEVGNLGLLIDLLTGPSGDLALTRPALSARITSLATPDDLPRLMALIDHPTDQMRAIAIEALASPTMRMGDNASDLKKREDLSKALASKLTPATPPVELAAVIKAAKGLRLFGARDALLELAKDIDKRHLQDINTVFMGEVLGKSLIPTLPEPEAGKAPDALTKQLRTYGSESITKLIAGLDDAALRPVAAKALGHIRDKSYLPLRDAIDHLAAHGNVEVCMDALILLVTKTYARDDIAKQCGRDKAKWQNFLATDRTRFDKIHEIVDWIAANGQYQFITDGTERLTKSRDYLTPAAQYIENLVNEPNFLPPLGLTKVRIEGLRQDVAMLGMNVRKAWAGARK